MDVFGFPTGPFQTNCYVATGAAEMDDLARPCVIIDPGMGAAATIRDEVAERNLAPEAIVLTHGHIDHIRDVAELARHWEIPVYIHPADNIMLADPSAVPSSFGALFNLETMQPVTDAEFFSDGEQLKFAGLSVEIIHAPGHSPGCVMLRVSDGADELLFSGDVLFAGAIGRTDLPGSDPAAMRQSLKSKVLPLADELMILPGHGPTSTIGQERQYNPFLLEIMASEKN